MSQKENTLKVLGFITSLTTAAAATFMGAPELGVALGVNVASSYFHDLTYPELKKLWLKHPNDVINHDIEKALIVAIKKVLSEIQKEFSTDYLGLEADEVAQVGALLNNLIDQTQEDYLSSFEQSLNNEVVLNFLNTTPENNEIKIAHLLQDQIQDLPPKFIEYFEQRFLNGVQIEFKQQLKQNKEAKTAMQMLVYESLQNGISNLTNGQDEIKAHLKTLQNLTINTIDTYGEIWLGAINQIYEQLNRIEWKIDELGKKVDDLQQYHVKILRGELKRHYIYNNELLLEIDKLKDKIPNILVTEQYQNLTFELEKNEQDFAKTQKETEDLSTAFEQTKIEGIKDQLDTKNQLLLTLSEKINKGKEDIETFIKNLFSLSKTLFNKEQPNSDRLEKARDLFLQGKIKEVKALLNYKDLLKDKIEYQELETQAQLYSERAKQKRQISANEFLVLAQVTQLNKDNSNWEKETNLYYKESIAAYEYHYNCFEYALFLQNQNQFELAILYYKKSQKLTDDIDNKTAIMNNLGLLNSNNNRYEAALELYEEALSIRRELAKKNPNAYLSYVATSLNNLANLHSDNNRYEMALGLYEEALSIYKNLAKKNLNEYLLDMAMTHNNLAALYNSNNRYEFALQSYEKALNILRELSKNNPNVNLSYVAGLLNNLAILHKTYNRYEVALNFYEEALSIRRDLAKNNPNTYLPEVAMTLNNLANLHTDKNRHKVALVFYEEALSIYRNLAKKNPNAYLSGTAMTLNNLATLHHSNNRHKAALVFYEEALSIYRNLAKKNPRVYEIELAKTLVNISMFYTFSILDKNKAVQYACEAKALSKKPLLFPFAQRFFNLANQIIAHWGSSCE